MTTRRNALQRATESCGYISGPPICNRIYRFGPPASFFNKFLGLLLATKEAVQLIGKEGGSVINIGSVVGSMPPAYTTIYSATKAAVDNLTISLSKELGPRNIRVNALNPGMIATEGARAAGSLEGDFHAPFVGVRTPFRSSIESEDIASLTPLSTRCSRVWILTYCPIDGGIELDHHSSA
jgi:3-oxoacyl-[acyl-carrier protein] reductase